MSASDLERENAQLRAKLAQRDELLRDAEETLTDASKEYRYDDSHLWMATLAVRIGKALKEAGQ